MKISKLFHWLYASVMLLPVFAIGGKTLYVMFNPNAKDSYSANETFTYYERNSTINTEIPTIVSGQDNLDYYVFKENYIYKYTTKITEDLTYVLLDNSGTNNLMYIDFYNLNREMNIYFDINYTPFNFDYFELNYSSDGSSIFFTFYDINDKGGEISLYSNNIFTFYIIWYETQYISISTFNDVLNVSESDYIPYTYTQNTIEQSTLDNAFYSAVDDMMNEPLFSWANNSFINQPITYISNLFGLPENSPILTMLSYWLSISVIWLCFDVIMYVPLLVHRWLDKGSLS